MSHTSGVLANFADFLNQFKAFVCGSVTQSFSGTGNGTMTLLDPRPGIIAETWVVECIAESPNAGVFSVTGSVSGAQADAHVGVEYDNGFIRFKINDGSVDFNADSPADKFTLTALASPLASTLVKTSYAGTGNGVVTRKSGATQTITESWTLTATSSTAFNVVGSVSGSQAAATVGTEYDNGFARFLINAGDVDFEAGDEFVLGATRLSAGGQTWEVLKDSAVRSDFQDVTNGYITSANITNETTGPFDRRIYFKSTGLAGSDEIYYCLTSFHNSTSYFNVELRNMVTYNPLLPLQSQASVSPKQYIVLNNGASTNPYRFIANGRRAVVLVRLGTVYESFMFGWNFPNGSPADYPLPYMIGGSSYNYYTIVSGSGNEHRAFFAPAGPYDSGLNRTNATLHVLARNGSSWIAVGNYTTANQGQDTQYTFVSPLRALGGIGAVSNDADKRKQGHCYGNNDRVLRPSCVWSQYAGFKGFYGDMDGVYHVSGEGINPEDVISKNEEDYLCWPSIFYTHREAFAAIKLA